MARANQKFLHPMKIFNKINLCSKEQLRKANKSVKERKRIDKMNSNKAKFGKK